MAKKCVTLTLQRVFAQICACQAIHNRKFVIRIELRFEKRNGKRGVKRAEAIANKWPVSVQLMNDPFAI